MKSLGDNPEIGIISIGLFSFHQNDSIIIFYNYSLLCWRVCGSISVPLDSGEGGS